jgi:hypothetical protein
MFRTKYLDGQRDVTFPLCVQLCTLCNERIWWSFSYRGLIMRRWVRSQPFCCQYEVFNFHILLEVSDSGIVLFLYWVGFNPMWSDALCQEQPSCVMLSRFLLKASEREFHSWFDSPDVRDHRKTVADPPPHPKCTVAMTSYRKFCVSNVTC